MRGLEPEPSACRQRGESPAGRPPPWPNLQTLDMSLPKLFKFEFSTTPIHISVDSGPCDVRVNAVQSPENVCIDFAKFRLMILPPANNRQPWHPGSWSGFFNTSNSLLITYKSYHSIIAYALQLHQSSPASASFYLLLEFRIHFKYWRNVEPDPVYSPKWQEKL